MNRHDDLSADAVAWVEANQPGTSCSIRTQCGSDVGQIHFAHWSSDNSYMFSSEELLAGWIDSEADLSWPNNKYFTQTIWRASKVCQL